MLLEARTSSTEVCYGALVVYDPRRRPEMPTTTELVEFLRQVPDIRVLLTCANRCGCRFGLRGGIIRHLLFSFQQINPNAVSLYDLVDAFSDIDVVVERGSDWPILQEAISSSLPFAGFHRWEVETLEKVLAIAKSYTLFPVDRILVWIDGRERDRPEIQLEGILVDANSVILKPSFDPDFSEQRGFPEEPMAGIMTLLRFGRYYFQFPEYRREIGPEAIENILKVPIEAIPEHATSMVNLNRIELAMLHVLFNARELHQAISFLDSVRRWIPEQWFESSQVLRTLSGPRFASANFIGASVYRPGPSLPLRNRLLTKKGEVASASGGIRSVIPWTTLSSQTDQDDGCCRYRDFSAGPAVVTWRRASSAPLAAELRNVEDYGVVVVRQSPRGYIGSRVRESGAGVPIPGFVRIGSALTIRLDHGYVRTISGGNVVFRVGLAQTISHEERQA